LKFINLKINRAAVNLYLKSLDVLKPDESKLETILHSNLAKTYNSLEMPDEALKHVENASILC
jgi:hypothetical protein